jgi:succinyl-CoA synthetase alpha subunit
MFGTGGRDLKEKVGGLMTLSGFDALEKDPNTLVITVVSKGSPGPTANKGLIEKIKQCKKPVVVVLLGAEGADVCPLF